MQQRHAKKRQDIQCLRTLAIVGVVGFHLFPDMFPSGYLGVDVFFVISGYLMTSILNYSKSNSLTGSSLYRFYTRRIKRIFPPYLLMVLLTVLFCQYFLTKSDWQDFRIDAFWALGFGTNVQSMVEKHEYFDATQKYDFLLHAWSLGCEIQFYVVAPFVLYGIAISSIPLTLSYCIISTSWALQAFCPVETISFGFVGCRLWQFLFGAVAYYRTKEIESSDFSSDSESDESLLSRKPTRWNRTNMIFIFCVILLVVQVCLPYIKSSDHYLTVIIRTLVTVMTTVVIELASIGANLPVELPKRICNGIAFVGDMSYSIYLIHWPMIVLAKYLLVFDQYYKIYFIIAILVLSYIQYTFLEQPLARQSSKVIYTMIGACYVVTVLLLLVNFNLFAESKTDLVKRNEAIVATCEADLWQLRNNCTMHPEIQWNREGNPLDSYLCSFEGTGNLSILLTGNSYVMRSYHTLIDEARHLFKHLYVATQSMCTVFISENEDSWRCNHVSNELPRIISILKPDVTIVNQRLSVSKTLNSPLPSLAAAENDSMVPMMANYWNLYSNFTKKIIVIEPSPTWYDTGRESFVKLLQLEKSLDSWHIPIKTYENEVDPGWWRTLVSMQNCSKCEAIPIRGYFCNDVNCDMYDEKTTESLFCDEGHLSSVGMRRFVKDIVKVIEGVN